DRGEAVRVAMVEPVRDVGEPRGVAHRAGYTAEDRRHGSEQHLRALRDPAVRALQPEQAGEPGRDAQRSASVAAGPDGDEPAGDPPPPPHPSTRRAYMPDPRGYGSRR